jgi:hypothetical protein
MCSTVFMLAAGIYWSGFLKDMLCLPRPLSPPLARISMSGSAALEYGFPSSHSTNAVSVTFYAIYMLRQSDEYSPTVNIGLQALFYLYAVSIIVGRLYCGMHGFLDVLVGSTLGALITVFQLVFSDWIDSWIFSGTYKDLIIATLVIFVLVRIHPEPADDCPCFDDSVAFSGVVVGINIGAWHYAQSGFAINDIYPSTVPFELSQIGLPKAIVRTLLGVVVIFVWRATAKPTLFKILPPLFRLLERGRMNLPRAFFLNASSYTSIPNMRDDDNVIPPASQLPQMLKNLAHPRKRSVSVGPQSASDAYETLAYRNRRRRESVNSSDGTVLEDLEWSSTPPSQAVTPAVEKAQPLLGAGILPTPMASRIHLYEQMMGTGNIKGYDGKMDTPPDNDTDLTGEASLKSEEENEKREIFMKLTKPRVRYDVEVVTKLIIYSGNLRRRFLVNKSNTLQVLAGSRSDSIPSSSNWSASVWAFDPDLLLSLHYGFPATLSPCYLTTHPTGWSSWDVRMKHLSYLYLSTRIGWESSSPPSNLEVQSCTNSTWRKPDTAAHPRTTLKQGKVATESYRSPALLWGKHEYSCSLASVWAESPPYTNTITGHQHDSHSNDISQYILCMHCVFHHNKVLWSSGSTLSIVLHSIIK